MDSAGPVVTLRGLIGSKSARRASFLDLVAASTGEFVGGLQGEYWSSARDGLPCPRSSAT